MNLICRTFWADLSSLPGGRGPDVSLKWSTTCRCVTASQGVSLAGLTCRHIGEYQPLGTIGDNQGRTTRAALKGSGSRLLPPNTDPEPRCAILSAVPSKLNRG